MLVINVIPRNIGIPAVIVNIRNKIIKSFFHNGRKITDFKWVYISAH